MGLVAFDFDGTLSDDEIIVTLGEHAGSGSEIEALTERAMRGELNYAQSLRRRAAHLDTLSTDDAEAASASVTLRPGVTELLKRLEELDIVTVIISGGFESTIEDALARANCSVDRVVANRLEIENEQLTGDVSGPLIEGTKDQALESLASEFEIPLSETVAVGDGVNDIPMLRIAGMAIGFNPKPAVRSHCDQTAASISELEAILITELGARSLD